MLRRAGSNLLSLRGTIRGLREKAGKAVKPGVAIVHNGFPFKVVKMKQGGRGRGASFVKASMKNLETSAVVEMTFTNDEMVELADLEKETVEFSWVDNSTNSFVFMNMQTFEEQRVTQEDVDNAEFMKEGQEIVLLKFREKIIGVELPDTIVCDVIETKQTGSGNLLAILDTGAKIQVPDFVKVGDRLKVNTSDKAYIERV